MTGEIVPLRGCLTRGRAEAIIRAAATPEGTIRLGWTDHALERMLEKDIVDQQVLMVLADGKRVNGPDWSEEHEDWVCVMRKTVSGRMVHIVVGIDERDETVTIVTAF